MSKITFQKLCRLVLVFSLVNAFVTFSEVFVENNFSVDLNTWREGSLIGKIMKTNNMEK